MATLSRQPDEPQPVAPIQSAEIGKPENTPTLADQAPEGPNYGEDIDLSYWLECMDDAERAERDWRKRGREVIEIYRGEKAAAGGRTKSPEKGTTYNILYANTEVMLGVVYQKPPQPVVRSRFVSPKTVPILPQPPMMPPPGMIGPQPPVAGPVMSGSPPGVAQGVPPGVTGAPPLPPQPPVPPGPPPLSPQLPVGAPAGPLLADAASSPMSPPGPAPLVGQPGGMPALNPPAASQQKDIETAAAIIEKCLEIVVDDEHSNEAIKTAIKDVLLPGRGTCRVRWKPQMQTQPMPGGPLPDGTAPTEEVKVDEQVDDEYVYWEDVLFDPVRQAKDCDWVAFRHLFSKKALMDEFSGNPKFDAYVAANRLTDWLIWTDESAAKSPPGGGSAMKTAKSLGDHRRKAMVWEVWDRVERQIIWLIRDGSGIVLRVDPDSLQLQGFFPTPVPMLAITTSDSRIPRSFYDLYAKLAADLDAVADKISRLQDKMKVRGAYNASSKDIKDILTADDGKMLPVAGVDMLNGGLQNHIWLLPIAEWMQALQQLYIAEDNIKNAIYEVMGISDIMRGATKATETATAQRIKGSMGVSRMEDMKGMASNFVRDMLRLKAEIICKNFDPETLARMTGEEVTPSVMAIIRSDLLRTCTVDIEADSTVIPDEAAEQESMSMIFGAISQILMGAQGMLQTGMLPPPMVMQLALEMIKMALHPIRYSRPVVELINGYQEQLEQIIAVGGQLGPPQPPPGAPPPQGNAPGGPSGSARAPRPEPGGGPPRPNGATRPPIPGTPPTPQLAM